MATIKDFESLDAWIKARDVCKEIDELRRTTAFSRDYSLCDQIRRSSGSVMDNIAEGFERGNRKEFILFLAYAKGSCGECRSQLYRAFDSGYIQDTQFKKLLQQVLEISRMIAGLITHLNRTSVKGSRLKGKVL